MEQKKEIKLSFKDKSLNFYQFHKVKIFFLFFILIILLITTVFIQQKKEKNNTMISQKYVLAGLNLSQDKKDEAKNLLIEIILSKNKFYSVIALNKIIELNLIDSDEKILEYFNILENLNLNEDKLDLIIFKKSLFLLKISKNLEGKKLLEELIKKDSKIKKLAEEILLN